MIKKALLALAATVAMSATQAAPDKTECIAPAKPGGGFDLTCKLAQGGLQGGNFIDSPMRVTYMPGGIGAVAYNTVIAQRPDEAGTIVAFSGGSLLNLAIGKFGRYGVNDVKWLGTAGADYGAIIVRADSPFQSLKDLMAALKADPTSVVFGAGGSVGSQDWMKSALVAKAAGVDFKSMRYVAFEGGGEAMTALQGGHVKVYSGDASEVAAHLKGGRVRVLGILSADRLPGELSAIPTAKEQGYDVQWPIIRGFYVGPKVADADYAWWVATFDKMLVSPEFAKLREAQGLFPFDMTGAKLDAYVKERVKHYAELAKEFGMVAQ
ncbi:Bug family tripartite tricarboxylate transporter substrate binding protein [Denitromonas ohlonensis]|uniref:Tripartite tricarboxylate transporter substrate binding protein n=2 Tax=Denitromonas TaxID=139331 RepID=A0A558E2M2_9RHOO|nr:tripartite tricarboxylate transporter substrate binding protein [Denitromonas ohlonensis]TVO68384.1 tripartite tricarboxylate transporter substrate binding protein [Denitromonas ohlonensis]TVO74662.1 tripartite tricarboxylate transporter substrate binding protein [Denitromonas ohlonensis]TVT51059.1 MAG: tripartite tricarboxylate transporter substrate binding protein [Denitromonas halophila]TVT67420.1 MAG: tripartite tricarboxylate transporter substrate binding protein [Denitromonas halophila